MEVFLIQKQAKSVHKHFGKVSAPSWIELLNWLVVCMTTPIVHLMKRI